jgi:transposase
LHLVTERGGKPIRWQVTAGQRHESPVATPLLAAVLERMWPEAVAGDKAFSTAEIRNWLAEREIEAVIPPRSDELGGTDYDREAYRERSIIECTINRLKRYRRIATRYEKLVCRYSAMIAVACILEWL